ncbi:S41 family peptidase [Candidatus Microgenomates bacterium]|jgi:carboxyl-terminal processing protease|nr:MAG: S41 family peptidase [Candidatus Microgenomates bacterium]
MKLTLRQIRRIILALIFLVLAGGVGYYFGKREVTVIPGTPIPKIQIQRIIPPDKQAKADFDLFWLVWDRLEESYLDKSQINYSKMIHGAISGMVSSLEDPYTVFLPPSDNEDAKADLRGDFEGVGIQIGYNQDQMVAVVAPLSGTPAEAAGIKAGDIITRIVDEKNGVDEDTAGMSLPEAVKLIRGTKGSTVKLMIYREGLEKPFEVTLKRDTIVVKSVEVNFEEKEGKKIAVLKLSRFGERTYEEWEEAVNRIKKEESSAGNAFGGIVFDLRNNPGGFLQGSIFIASEFLSSGVVVQQDRGDLGKETYSVNRKGKLLKEPLVVLINPGSASASEIVAGALKERGRAELIGEKSFGKGTVQEAEDLPGGAGLHITVARWLLPSGKTIDKEGVSPDYEVKMDETDQTKDPQLEKAFEILLNKQ